jgi:hypothetical protein
MQAPSVVRRDATPGASSTRSRSRS